MARSRHLRHTPSWLPWPPPSAGSWTRAPVVPPRLDGSQQIDRGGSLVRRTLVITTIAATALGLSACGGAPKDLSQDKAKSSMLEAGDLPDGGWEAGSVDETKPKQDDKSAEQIFKNAKDVPQACKDAMNAMSTMSADNPSSYAKRSFTKGSGTDKAQVETILTGHLQEMTTPRRAGELAADCMHEDFQPPWSVSPPWMADVHFEV